MRILLANDYGRPAGGAENRILALREGLRARGHEVRLFTSDAELGGAPLEADATCRGHRGVRQLQSLALNGSAWRGLRRELATFRPEVVHVRIFLGQLSPLILPALRGVPALHQAVTYRRICPVGTKLLPDGTSCREPAGRACLRNRCLPGWAWPTLMLQKRLAEVWSGAFDRTVTQSQAIRARYLEAGIAPVDVVPNGVDERPPRPPLADPPTVGFAGRLSREKGVDTLLRAFARVRETVGDARLVVAGDGPRRAELEALAGALGLGGAVTFAGHLERSAMERRLEAAWVQAVPSLWDEPFGNVATEAMMRGTAVVASAAGALPELVVEGETGALVPPGDADALARTLADVLRDRERAEALGAAGRRRALAEYREERVAERFEAIYREMVAAGVGAGPGRRILRAPAS